MILIITFAIARILSMILRFIVVAFVYHDFVDGYPDDCGCYDHHEGYGCHDDADGFPQFRQNATPVEHESGMRRDDHRIMKMIGLKRTTLMFKPHDLGPNVAPGHSKSRMPGKRVSISGLVLYRQRPSSASIISELQVQDPICKQSA